MSDAAVVAMAIAAMAGAVVAHPLHLLLVLGLAAGALASQRAVLVIGAAALLASCLGARSWDGLRPPAAAPVAGVATLVTDPEPAAGALRVELRLGHRRVEAWAHGAAAGALYHRLAGERVRVSGTLRPAPDGVRSRLAQRHIAARVSLRTVDYVDAGPLPVRVANALRRLLTTGAASLSREQRSLFAGFVLGDDREQPPEITDDFRGSGLSHLLVVSGANVAFVLVLVAPVLRRLRWRTRVVAGVAVLLAFGLVTRWEPSVLRAIAMAAIALVAGAVGRPASGLRVLALAVTGLVLIDPMLVHSVGFLLSVGACAGIAVLARPLATRLPGPRPLATAIGVTVGAQVGVAPVLVPVFGPLPLASLPANLLAVPAAAPIMVWGMTAGVVAGAVPESVAALLHIPTRVLIGWVAEVAHVGANAPLGSIGMPQLGVIAALAAVAAGVARRARLVLALVAGLALLGPPTAALARSPSRLAGVEVADGIRVWRDAHATVLVVGQSRPLAALAGLRQRGVTRADVVVVTAADRTTAQTLDAIRARVRPRAVVGRGGIPVVPGEVLTAGRWRVTIVARNRSLDVVVCAQAGTTVGSCG